MRLETERLFLREMNEGDFEALYRVLGDADIMKHYPYVFDEKRVRGWITRNIERYKSFGFGLWAVCLKDSGEMIGDAGLTMQLIDGTIRPEIGYHIRRDQQRRGYAKEAASAVRDWAFRNMPFGEIYSYMKNTNLPSQKTAESWGAKFEKTYTDAEGELTAVFRMTREEWMRRKGNMELCMSHSVFPVPNIEKTAEYYHDILGFRRVDYLGAKEKHICLYRDGVEFILTQSNGQKVIPNRELYGYGGDAYVIVRDQEALQDEYEARGAKIVQRLHKTDYHNQEFVLEDIDGRWIYFGIKE